MSRQEDFDKAADEYSVGCDEQDDRIYAELHYKRGCEYGYQYARENLWYDAQGDNVPEYGREVIVIGRDGKIFYGHRPDPKEVTMVEGKPYHSKTYDKNGWNWPDIALWLDVEVPDKLIDEITTKYFDERKQSPRKEE